MAQAKLVLDCELLLYADRRACFSRDGERRLCKSSGDVGLWSGVTRAVAV